MKSLLISSLSLLSFINAEAAPERPISGFIHASDLEKIYLKPDQIILFEDAIFYFTGAGVVQASFVGADLNGLFVLKAFDDN